MYEGHGSSIGSGIVMLFLTQSKPRSKIIAFIRELKAHRESIEDWFHRRFFTNLMRKLKRILTKLTTQRGKFNRFLAGNERKLCG